VNPGSVAFTLKAPSSSISAINSAIINLSTSIEPNSYYQTSAVVVVKAREKALTE